MPHVIIKLWPGRTDEQKERLADKIAQDVAEGLKVALGDVSVAFEEVRQEDWRQEVYEPDILGKKELLYKLPEYE